MLMTPLLEENDRLPVAAHKVDSGQGSARAVQRSTPEVPDGAPPMTMPYD
jgi:hypothetical protein